MPDVQDEAYEFELRMILMGEKVDHISTVTEEILLSLGTVSNALAFATFHVGRSYDHPQFMVFKVTLE